MPTCFRTPSDLPSRLVSAIALLFFLLSCGLLTEAQLVANPPNLVPDSKLSLPSSDYGLRSFTRRDISLIPQSALQSTFEVAGDGGEEALRGGNPAADKVCRPAVDPHAKARKVKILPALWQSFEFVSIQMSVDLAMDPIERGKLEGALEQGQFRSRYWQTLKNSRYTVYTDDDSVLTTYVGHPMGGAAIEFIWIQNHPICREMEFSNTKADDYVSKPDKCA